MSVGGDDYPSDRLKSWELQGGLYSTWLARVRGGGVGEVGLGGDGCRLTLGVDVSRRQVWCDLWSLALFSLTRLVSATVTAVLTIVFSFLGRGGRSKKMEASLLLLSSKEKT